VEIISSGGWKLETGSRRFLEVCLVIPVKKPTPIADDLTGAQVAEKS
jgi:hypothetical protein